MVYFIVHDGVLCRLLDALGEHEPSFAREALLPFIAEALHNTVEAVPPSQLKDALWLYLYLKREYVQLAAALPCPTGADAETHTAEGGARVMQCSPLGTGRLALSTLVVATLAPPRAPRSPAMTRATTEAEAHSSRGGRSHHRCASAALLDSAHRRLDELLRKAHGGPGHEGTAAAAAVTPTACTAAAADATGSAETHTTHAVLELALAAFHNPRRVEALLTPATLCLLVRDLESLWCLLYLCKQVRLRLRRQSEMLVGGLVGAASAVGNSSSCPSADELPSDEFFHDYELLLPAQLLEKAETVRTDTNAQPLCSVRALLQRCTPARVCDHWVAQSDLLRRARRNLADSAHATDTPCADDVDDQEKKAHPPSRTAAAAPPQQPVRRVPVLAPRPAPRSTHGQDHAAFEDAGDALPIHYPIPSVGIVIAPALSAAVPNPGRLAKNHRVDVIEQAAMRYYYDQLATLPRRSTTLASGGGGRGSADIFTHLQAQLSGGERSVIDPAQMGRHGLQTSAGARRAADAAHTTQAADSGIIPAHRRMKSLQQLASEKASFAQFMRESFIGLDIQIMALSGAAIGYYMGVLRGASKETCWTYAAFGLVVMMLVDAGLLLIRLGREDGATRRERKRIAKQRAKMDAAGKEAAEVRSSIAAELERELHRKSMSPEVREGTEVEKKNQ